MSDFFYRFFCEWWVDMVCGDPVWAAVYGAVAGGLAAGGYAWFAVRRKGQQVAWLRAMTYRCLRLPLRR
jgi:hypothetical protein